MENKLYAPICTLNKSKTYKVSKNLIDLNIRVFLFLFLWINTLTLHAQHTLTGTAIDGETQVAIIDAEIYNMTTGASTVTDKSGQFQFTNLKSGTYDIAIFSYEYSTKPQQVLVEKNTTQVFELERLKEQLSLVTLIAKREELFALKRLKAVEGTAIYSGKKNEVVLLDKVQGNLAANNSRQIYAQIVGLNIYEGNDGGLQLGIGGRGLDPNRTANFNTRQNGYDISADVLGYPESYYTPPAEALSQIQVLRGAASLQYGTQFGGLINFQLRQPPLRKKYEIVSRQSIGSFGLFNTFNSIGGTVGKLSYYTYYNFKNGNGYRENSGFTAHNFFGLMRYNFSEKTRLSFESTYFHYLAQQAGGLTDAQLADNPRQSTRTRNWFEVDWRLFNAKLEHSFGEKSDLSVSVFGLNAARNSVGYRGNPINLNENPVTSLDEQSTDGSYVLPRDLIKGTFQNWGAETRFLSRYSLRKQEAVFLVGAKLYKANNTAQQGAGSRGTDANFRLYDDEFPDYANQSNFLFPNFNVAFFGENIFYLSEKLAITPGFRFEYIRTKSEGDYRQVIFDNANNPIANQAFTDNRNFPRNLALFGIGMSYEANETLEVYANISQNYRSVTFSDIRVVNPTFIIDPDISDERGFTADAGLRGRWGKALSYDAGAFTLLYDDRIGVILDDRANRIRKNIGAAVIVGAEAFGDLNLKRLLYPENEQFKFSIFANTAFTYSRYTRSEENNVVGKQVEFIPLINLKTGIQIGYKNLLASTQFTYLSQQFTDVQNSATPPDGDIRSGVVGEIPAYHVIDVSLSYQYKKIRLETGINNLTNHTYFTRRATGYPGPGIIPSDGLSFYLTVGIKI